MYHQLQAAASTSTQSLYASLLDVALLSGDSSALFGVARRAQMALVELEGLCAHRCAVQRAVRIATDAALLLQIAPTSRRVCFSCAASARRATTVRLRTGPPARASAKTRCFRRPKRPKTTPKRAKTTPKRAKAVEKRRKTRRNRRKMREKRRKTRRNRWKTRRKHVRTRPSQTTRPKRCKTHLNQCKTHLNRWKTCEKRP